MERRVTGMEPRLTMITLGVSDMAASRAFYERLGFRASSASNPNVTFFHTGGTILGLFGHSALAEDAGVADSAPSFRGVSISHNVGSEDEVDAVFAHALKCGARATQEPHKVFWGGYCGYFSDPDGHLWEIAFNPFAPNDADGRMILPD